MLSSYRLCGLTRLSVRLTHTIKKNMISQSRQWVKIDQTDVNHTDLNTQFNNTCDSANNDNSLQFSLMSYNILSQNLLNNHLYLYRHCDQSSISWPERGNRIIRELLESNCDIICLQEVNSEHYHEKYMPAMQTMGYLSLFKKKTGDKLDGCAIFYKSLKFSVEDTVELEFKRLDLSPILDRDNIALIAKFKICDANSDVKLIVATTHLLYNPRRGDVKTSQLRLLFAEIDKLSVIERSNSLYNPIIFCGDINCEPGSPIYQFIRKGYANFNNFRTGDLSGQSDGIHRGFDVDSNSLIVKRVSSDCRFVDQQNDRQIDRQNDCRNDRQNDRPIDRQNDRPIDRSEDRNRFKHYFHFDSVYEKTQYNRKYISTYTGNESGFVDYIFYTKSDKLQLIEYLQLLSYEQIRKMGFIPNSVLGSDHLSLMAKFLIRH